MSLFSSIIFNLMLVISVEFSFGTKIKPLNNVLKDTIEKLHPKCRHFILVGDNSINSEINLDSIEMPFVLLQTPLIGNSSSEKIILAGLELKNRLIELAGEYQRCQMINGQDSLGT